VKWKKNIGNWMNGSYVFVEGKRRWKMRRKSTLREDQ